MEDCKIVFEDLKQRKKYRYITFKINDEKTCIEVDKIGDKNETFEDFKRCMLQDLARYAVFDYDAKKDGKTGNLGFISWVDDQANVTTKMLYACTKQTLKDKLQLTAEWQITSPDEFTEEEMPAKWKK
ncbi:hypothetical protein ACF0H5_002479 [Mactra antiquata]